MTVAEDLADRILRTTINADSETIFEALKLPRTSLAGTGRIARLLNAGLIRQVGEVRLFLMRRLLPR
jgi:hypothetical protein